MFWFVIACLLALAAAVLVTVACLVKPDRSGSSPRGVLVLIGTCCLVLAFAVEVITGLKSVPVKNVGVPLAFGSVQGGYLRNGIHETWEPWIGVTDVDETVQTTTFEDGGNDNPASGQCDGGLAVRIGGQQIACADVTIQWRVLPSAAGTLFEEYANQGNLMSVIEDAEVIRELKLVVNQDVGDYNPITDVADLAGSNTSTSQFTSFGPEILAQMRSDIGSEIYVKSVLFPLMRYDAATQAKLDAIQQEYADYAVAREQIQVNIEQAQAYQKLGTPTAPDLLSQCLGYMDDLIKDGKVPPVGMCNLTGTFSAIAG